MAAADAAVYEHIGKIVNKVIAEKPTDAYGLVEVLSRLVREPAKGAAPAELTAEELESLIATVAKAKALDKVPSDESGPLAVCAIPDYVEDAEMFSWAGVGLGEMESYKVQCSLRNMAAAQLEGYTKVRFWGKILGTDADYYVAEAEKDGGDGEEAEDPDQEASGSPGTNFFIYFVCTDLSGAWTKLPNIRPKDIVAAKKIKKMFSGNPDAKVITHPYFDGLEKVLLRAAIARITADTTICLKGMLIREEDAEEVSKPEEFKWPMPSELTEKKAWIHTQPHILNVGRTTHKELPDAEEDPAGFAAAKELQEHDPSKDMIRSVDSDGLEWNIKQFGDMALYKAANGAAKSNAVTCVRSLTWPGAVTVSRGQYYASLYIGNGQESGKPEFFFPAPLDVQDEPEDTPEPEEPQGTPEPVGGEEAAEE